MTHFHTWQSVSSDIKGFFLEESAAIWDLLLENQNQSATYTPGSIAEIGVLYGKSASLAALHARKDEKLVLCDLNFSDEVKSMISSITSVEVVYLQGNSANLVGSQEAQKYAKQFRWIHIDGEHTGQGVTHDLMLADQWLNERGIICCDDFMNPVYPQLTAAVFNYIDKHPFELTMFLCGYNKCYLTRPKAAHSYLKLILNNFYFELSCRGLKDFSIYKTTLPSDMNCFGIAQRFSEHDYYGLDENPTLIVI